MPDEGGGRGGGGGGGVGGGGENLAARSVFGRQRLQM